MPTTSLSRSVALNPLPWILHGASFTLDRPTLRGAMRDVAAIGYSNLTIELPSDMDASEFGDLLAEHGLRPAPGYFSAAFHDSERHDDAVERIRRHAAAHLELGVDSSFIATDLTPERMATPAVGVGHDSGLMSSIADGLAAAAEAGKREGVQYGLHPHVGSMVEIEAEVRAVLDATEGSALGFGPDTGHLRWAGALPEQVIGDYAHRVVNVHLKDVDLNAARDATARGEDYLTATGSSKVWIEPGRGGVDFDAVLAALPSDFAGWFIVEVDVPNLPTPTASSVASLEFLRRHPYFSSATG